MVSAERKTDHTKARNRRVHTSRNFWAGLLFGAGTFSVLEQSIFHFFLQWHHFYEGNGTQAMLTGEGHLSADWLGADRAVAVDGCRFGD